MNDFLSIITSLIAVLTLISTIFYTRHNRFISIVAGKRSKNLDFLEMETARFLSLASYDRLVSLKSRHLTYDEELLQSAYALYYHYKFPHQEEEIQKCIEEIYHLAVEYLQGEMDDKIFKQNISSKTSDFFKKSKIFYHAYWHYLQDHAKAKKFNSKIFKRYYRNALHNYANSTQLDLFL